MIRFFQTKVIPVTAAIISIASTLAIEPVVTPTTPVVTPVTPVVTPTVTPAILQQVDAELNKFNAYAQAGCIWCQSHVQTLGVEASQLMVQFVADIPTVTHTVATLVTQSVEASTELRALLLAFEGFSSVITT